MRSNWDKAMVIANTLFPQLSFIRMFRKIAASLDIVQCTHNYYPGFLWYLEAKYLQVLHVPYLWRSDS